MVEIDASTQPTMANRTPLRIGTYALDVRDLDLVSDFYQRIVGLTVIRQDKQTVELGVAGISLLHLCHRPNAKPDDAKEAGLFHTAFLMPTRSDLADWYAHALAEGLSIARTSDHDVNEAIYYDDPEGNGCECYADRPAQDWKWADDGTVHIPALPFDPGTLLPDAKQTASQWSVPAGLRIGHINLRVGDITTSEAFWCRAVGLHHTGRANNRLGGTISFMSSGRYHHHVATTNFTSAGATARDPDVSGLAWFKMETESEAVLESVRSNLVKAGKNVAEIAGGFETQDPWGTRVRFACAAEKQDEPENVG